MKRRLREALGGSETTPQMWGGVECTINRVGDRYFSQLARNGHRSRPEDIDRFAELGLRALRFPILWEELAPNSSEIDWTPVDAQLDRMRSVGLRTIAGLVHHGSGPPETSLIDPRFPEKLASFARQVAERYPWIDAYTPVNEPLTTARFSGLYGHWFPHGQDGFTFVRALLNQLRGVVLSMRAIREINPDAVLIQTEDLGKTFSSPKLRYQADFENERRWLTWDLLSGRVGREHPMWSYLLWLGAEEVDVEWFLENACPPEVVGVNHYITSERYLDENLRDHAPETHGGNGRDRYADVAAVRVRLEGSDGPEALLRETCIRYALPVAVTEAHLGCTREEQLRWLGEVWGAAQKLLSEGHDVCAVTAWSLLGAFDWNSLLTRESANYEPGAYDVRGPVVRETAVAKMIRGLMRTNSFDHPVLQTPGWWRRQIRLLPSIAARSRDACPSDDIGVHVVPGNSSVAATVMPLLIMGARGAVAEAFVHAAEMRGLRYLALDSDELDLADADAVNRAIRANKPWAVINCAGFARVDDVEAAEDACLRAVENVARACAAADIPLLTFSSDHVFDGCKPEPYSESDPVAPLNAYGIAKMLADAKASSLCAKSLIIRPGKLLAPSADADPFADALRLLARGERVAVADDIHLSVSFVPDLVNVALDLLIDSETGVWHIANSGSVTPAQLLTEAAEFLHLDVSRIDRVPNWSLRRLAPRARNRALQSERAQFLPSYCDALHRYCVALPELTEQMEPAVAIR